MRATIARIRYSARFLLSHAPSRGRVLVPARRQTMAIEPGFSRAPRASGNRLHSDSQQESSRQLNRRSGAVRPHIKILLAITRKIDSARRSIRSSAPNRVKPPALQPEYSPIWSHRGRQLPARNLVTCRASVCCVRRVCITRYTHRIYTPHNLPMARSYALSILVSSI